MKKTNKTEPKLDELQKLANNGWVKVAPLPDRKKPQLKSIKGGK